MDQFLLDKGRIQETLLQEELEVVRQEVNQLKQEKEELLMQIKALRKKEVLLQLVLDNIPQLIFWKDCNSVFQGCNRRWAKAIGLKDPDDVIGKTDYDLYPNATNLEEYIKKDRRVIETGIPEFHLEYRPQKDIWYDTKKIPIEDPKNEIVGVLATIEDITERKKAEDALRIAEEKYREIFENALEGIFQTTPDARYLSVNPAMAKIYGYESPEEMIANVREISTQVYVDSSCRDEFQRIMEEQGEIKGFEYQSYRRDRSKIWVQENTRAVRDCQGKLLYYEGMIQDITKRKQEEEILRRQLQELRIEIDHQKREHQVAEITQTIYFQELQAEIEAMRFDGDF